MLISNRLSYKRMGEEDFELFQDLFTNEQVMKYAYLNVIKTKTEAEKMYGRYLRLQAESNGDMFGASLKAEGSEIGIVDYEVIHKHPQGGIIEIGYFIKPEYWGAGYATEMGKALIEYLFTTTIAHKIIANCNSANAGSEKIMIKLGMKKEGVARKVRYKNNQWEDETNYGLLREEWSRSRGGRD